MDIRNEEQLNQAMMEILKNVIDSVSDYVSEQIRFHIKTYTYEFDPRPNKEYEGGSREPSYEFENSYRFEGRKTSLKEVSNKLFYDWSKMTVDRITGRHFDNGRDFRKKLGDAMNIDGFFAYKLRGAYWDKFIESMDKMIDRKFLEALKQAGLNVK